MRLMGLDYGALNVGVALSDPLRREATPYTTIRRERENHLRRTFSRIEEIVKNEDVTGFVVGLPLHMDGAMSERAEAARAFGERLSRRTGLPVMFFDERLTSFEAESLMKEAGLKQKKRKEIIDAVAAGLILQDYLDHEREQNAGERYF